VKTSISAGMVLISTLLGFILVLFPRNSSDFLFVLLSLVITCSTSQSLKPVRVFLKFALPIMVPVLLIHTLINPMFPVREYFFNFLPFRPRGLDFSISISQQISVLLAVSTMWMFTCRDELLDWLVARNFPLTICMTFAQAISIISLIERRGNAVYKAQQARGIATGPGIVKRVKALPFVMLPVIATVINETEWRATALVSRGFASRKMSSMPISSFDKYDLFKAALLATPILLKITI
jgi:energy-coupling factor transport system permease protein